MRLEYVRDIECRLRYKLPFQVFLSVQPFADGYIGVAREYIPKEFYNKSHLVVIKFDKNWNQLSLDYLCEGEDPRLFRFENKYFILTWLRVGQERWDHFLVDIVNGEKTKLKINNLDHKGKNWMPIVGMNGLFIIKSLIPLCILKVDINTGSCTSIVNDVGEIGMYRGGSVAYFKNSMIRGLGHKTINFDNHYPFFYSVDLINREVKVHDLNLGRPGIIDPTSYWDDYVVCCETKIGWWDVIPVEHKLYRLIL